MQNAEQLRTDLGKLGVAIDPNNPATTT